MNQHEAGEILRANVKYLSEPLKSAVEFTLANFYQPNASDIAKKFLASVPYEIFMARDLRETNPALKAQIDTAFYTLMNDPEVWLNLEDLPHEIWRDVIGYEGLYKVSNLGRVKSFAYGTEKIRKPVFNRPGYFSLVLYKNEIPTSTRIHVLVAQAFIPNPESKAYVNHIDANKLNNRVNNLEWLTPKENWQHASNLGLQKSGCDAPKSKFTAEEIRYIREVCIPNNKEFGFSALARKFNVGVGTIERIYKREHYKNII